jgi:predicted TPR repeat methyltransferase
MKLRKLKRSSSKKAKGAKPSPRIQMMLDKAAGYIESGRLGQADTICREIIDLSPRTSEAYNMLGIIYQEQGLFDEAAAVLRKSIELDSSNANALFNLGTILGQQGQYEKSAAAFLKGLKIAPRIPKARNNLGLALIRLGRLDEAVSSLEQATVLDPHYGEAWFNLGDAYYCAGKLQKAVDAYQRCIRLIPDFVEAQYNLSIVLHDLDLTAEAMETLQRTIELAPEHMAARHMLAALSGKTPESAPRQFITNLFDQYSHRFDVDLVDRLEYRIPTRLRTLLSDYVEQNTRFSKAMDLGCGTGLSGLAFRDSTDYLAGIDISKKMLEKAEGKNIYDDLLAGELCELLPQLPDLYNLFIAADVMVYIGNLAPLFNAVSSKAQPGAYFLFSVESEQKEDFALQATGRYSHSRDYITRLAADNNFTIIAQKETGIRKEGEDWIPGDIYLLQKNAA